MTHAIASVPVEMPVCPPSDEGARDTRALMHILLAVGFVWAASAAWRRARVRRTLPRDRGGVS
jgi:hypothetical protein